MFKHRCLNIEAQNEQAISIIMPQASGVEGDGHHPPTDGAPCTTQRVTGQNKHSNSPSGGLTPPNLGHAKLGLFFRVKKSLRRQSQANDTHVLWRGGEERRVSARIHESALIQTALKRVKRPVFKKKQENTKTPKNEATPLNDPHRVSHRTLHHIYITLRPVTAADMEGRDAVITQWERTVTHLHPAAAFTYNGRVAVIPPAGAGRPCPLLSSALSSAGFITRQGSLRCSPGVCLVIVRASRL